MTNKLDVPPPRLVDETDEEYEEREATYFHVYITNSRDNRRYYDEEGNMIPAKTGAQRQRAYEQEQSQDDKKRPGWWLSEEVIKAITDRQWKHVRPGWKTKSDRIDMELRYMLRIVEAVEAKAREVDGFAESNAIDLVLEKIAALEVPYIPLFTEETIKAKLARIYGNPD